MCSHMTGETSFQDILGEYSGNLQEGLEARREPSRKHEMTKTPIEESINPRNGPVISNQDQNAQQQVSFNPLLMYFSPFELSASIILKLPA